MLCGLCWRAFLILMSISAIENNVFYITCFKSSITAKRRLVCGMFLVEQNLMPVWIECVGYSKITI